MPNGRPISRRDTCRISHSQIKQATNEKSRLMDVATRCLDGDFGTLVRVASFAPASRQGQEIIIMRSKFVISALVMASCGLSGTFAYAQTSRDGTVGSPAARQDIQSLIVVARTKI